MKRWLIPPLILLAVIIAARTIIFFVEPQYAYAPPKHKVVNDHLFMKGFDLWGKWISAEEGNKQLKTKSGSERLSSMHGAIKVDKELLQIGRETFYKETFGNEVFLTDIVGILNGPFTAKELMEAIVELGGKGTNNLQVELARDATVGGKHFEKGETIQTGIDVPRGAYAPLGMPVTFSREGLRVGITCAACHATVDPKTKKVIEGAPNSDLNAGLILALATNSAAYFTHTEIQSLQHFVQEIEDAENTVITSDGEKVALPEDKALEKAVDRILLNWPRGNFDSTIDMVANPAQIPDSFTMGDHPYSWSGFAMAGPFNGLSVFSNNVHAQNADALAQSHLSEDLFGIDKEVYLGTILQNAANEKFRYDSEENGPKPSLFFRKVDPTPGVPGVNQLIKPPQFPAITLMAPDGLIASTPEYDVNEQNHAVSAWQNTIDPPQPPTDFDKETIAQGRRVFVEAGCVSCHAGKYLTNHKIISAEKIGTEPSRARALKKTGKVFAKKPMTYPPHTPVPVPEGTKPLAVPTDNLSKKQIRLAFAHGNSPGGYKVPSLIGLYWTAPYLHDGGVAVGKNAKTQIGLPNTVLKGIRPDPRNSLRALIDRSLRAKVVRANQSSKSLQQTHVTGKGHAFWVDQESGFTKKQQEALITYLLSLHEISPKK